MRRIFTLVSLLICVHFCMSLRGQEVSLRSFTFAETVYINKLSDNGLWAVASNVDANNSTLENYPYLLDVAAGTSVSLLTEAEMLSSPDCGVRDVTDDGRTVVGSYQGKPATCTINTDGISSWRLLTLPESMADANGYVSAITPDGKIMVGTLYYNNGNLDGGYFEYPVMWKEGVPVELPGMPTGDGTYQLNRAIDISADGKIIVGGLMYIFPDDIKHYVYRVDEQSYELIGTSDFFATGSAVTSVCLSTNGEWAGGTARLITPVEGSQHPDQQEIPYTYNTKTKEFLPYTTSEHHGAAATAMFNNGLMAVASPISNPYRTQMYLIGGYYYNLELILGERYGIDFATTTGIDNSGLAISVSADGKTVAGFSVNEGNYVVTFPESIEKAASGVNLLARSYVTPEAGSAFSYFKGITIGFDKAPTVVNGTQAALYKEGSDAPIRSSISITPTDDESQCKTFNVNFRNTPLEDGVKYTVKVPAGTFRLGETDTYNREIEVTYTGRSEKPVQVVSVNLEDGMEVASLSYSIPVTMRFDTRISLTEGSKGVLYQEGVSNPISDLTLATSADMLAAYPSTKRNLFKGVNYVVKIPAGAVTDIMGNCSNEEITYHYTGAYIPEAPADTLLFADDFTDPSASYNNFMLYEGDHLTPNSTAQSWQFDADNTPWYFMISEDENSYDYCAGSISMYNPAGKSDDWMVTNQIYLPNAFCTLLFDVQSYLTAKKDSLKVYVYADDAIYTSLTGEVVSDIKSKGICVYDQQEASGNTEEYLSGEWAHRKISLEQFAGKHVYIAFVNQNTNQSALFVDNIKVTYKSNCLLALNTKTTVVNQSETAIGGVVRITDESNTYEALTLFFHNEEKTVCDTIRTTGVALRNGDIHEFLFDKKLPLAVGEENRVTVGVILGEDTKTTDFTIKNLAFETDKKVVIEEVTGTWCSNCPDGMVAIEHMEEALPGRIIPVCIHSNDIFGNDDYATALGLTALPTARVNRRDSIVAPIVINMDTYEYSFVSATGNESWMDLVLRELETEADADITLSAGFDRTTGSLQVNTNVTYAISKAGVAANLFYVLLEDGLKGTQINGRANMDNPIYGDWGKNGIYGGQATVQMEYHDVARAVLANSQSTISGYSGIVPATVKSGETITASITFEEVLNTVSDPAKCKVAAMLLDANTGRVINANVAPLTDLNPETAEVLHALPAKVKGGKGCVHIDLPAEATVLLYTPRGTTIGQSTLQGRCVLSTKGHKGVTLVRIVTAGQASTYKVRVE